MAHPQYSTHAPPFDACYDKAAQAFREQLANGFFKHRKVRKYRCQLIWVMRRWLKEWRERGPTKRALEAIAACKAELDVIECLC